MPDFLTTPAALAHLIWSKPGCKLDEDWRRNDTFSNSLRLVLAVIGILDCPIEVMGVHDQFEFFDLVKYKTCGFDPCRALLRTPDAALNNHGQI